MSVRGSGFLQPTRVAGLVIVTLLLLGSTAAVSPQSGRAAPTATATLSVKAHEGGTITSDDYGINCGSDCFQDYELTPNNPTVTVTLTPKATQGWQFSRWGESDCTSQSGDVCTIRLSASKTVTPTFVRTSYRLTLEVAGTGSGSVAGTGISCPGDCVEDVAPGTTVQLTATPSSSSSWGGWSDCSGTSTTCSVPMSADRKVIATFNAITGTPTTNHRLTLTVNGIGKVSGPGIECPTDCEEDFAAGTAVVLTAAATGGAILQWSGDCTGTSASCALTMSQARSVVASFMSGPIATPAGTPAIDQALDPLPAKPPAPVEQVIVKVDGTGHVTSSAAGRVVAQASATKPINCGMTGTGALRFDCYGEYRPGQALTLKAKAAPGYSFKRWTGACAGSGPTCRVVTKDARTTTAVFEASGSGAAVAALLKPPRLRVRWKASVGAGNLLIQGSTTLPAAARVDMRRPGGGPLATRRLKLQGGAFRQMLPLRRGALAGNAKLFPGGFTVALTGRAGKLKLPLQMQTIAIPAPAEGVVRRAFKSRSENGKALLRFPAGTKEAWANFRFETQPRLNQKLSVRWYWPDGKLLGTVRKSNRPVVSSYLRLATGLPSGAWVAELRAGKRIVQRLSVRVG